MEPESATYEAKEVEAANPSAPGLNAPQASKVKLEGDKMENWSKGILEGFSELGPAMFSLDTARKIAALSIETGEKIVKATLDFQAKANEWTKDTPLAPLFAARISMTRKIAELSANTARRAWRIEKKPAA